MLSTEVDEHVELMDRVLVFREHELFREIERSELSRETLVSAFFGEGGEVSDGAVGRECPLSRGLAAPATDAAG